MKQAGDVTCYKQIAILNVSGVHVSGLDVLEKGSYSKFKSRLGRYKWQKNNTRAITFH